MAVNSEIYSGNLPQLRQDFQNAIPYPNIVIDSFLEQASSKEIIDSFPEVEDTFWTNYIHYNEKKHGLTKWEYFPNAIQNLITELRHPHFITWLEQVTQIENLFPDPDLEGSGLHQTKRNGFLNIHADFTVHPKHKTWKRRVNLLLYLNQDWNSNWGGDLELWNADMSKCEKAIAPLANRLVIFATGKETYHGYPEPLKCPERVSRKSIALYYYTKENSPQSSSTSYQPRPVDGAKKWFIYVDTFLISLYTKIKGVFGLNDDFVSSILKYFNKK